MNTGAPAPGRPRPRTWSWPWSRSSPPWPAAADRQEQPPGPGAPAEARRDDGLHPPDPRIRRRRPPRRRGPAGRRCRSGRSSCRVMRSSIRREVLGVDPARGAAVGPGSRSARPCSWSGDSWERASSSAPSMSPRAPSWPPSRRPRIRSSPSARSSGRLGGSGRAGAGRPRGAVGGEAAGGRLGGSGMSNSGSRTPLWPSRSRSRPGPCPARAGEAHDQPAAQPGQAVAHPGLVEVRRVPGSAWLFSGRMLCSAS